METMIIEFCRKAQKYDNDTDRWMAVADYFEDEANNARKPERFLADCKAVIKTWKVAIIKQLNDDLNNQKRTKYDYIKQQDERGLSCDEHALKQVIINIVNIEKQIAEVQTGLQYNQFPYVDSLSLQYRPLKFDYAVINRLLIAVSKAGTAISKTKPATTTTTPRPDKADTSENTIRQFTDEQIELLKSYFVAAFKGMGNNMNYFDENLLKDLKKNRVGKEYAEIAKLIFESPKFKTEFKTKPFGSWYKTFCNVMGIKKLQYRPIQIEIDDAIRSEFYYLT